MTWGSQGRVPLEVVGELRDAQHEALVAAGFGALKRTQRKPLCPELSTGEERQTKVCPALRPFLDVNGFILRKMRKRGSCVS